MRRSIPMRSAKRMRFAMRSSGVRPSKFVKWQCRSQIMLASSVVSCLGTYWPVLTTGAITREALSRVWWMVFSATSIFSGGSIVMGPPVFGFGS